MKVRTITRARLEQMVVDAITHTDEHHNLQPVPQHRREDLLTVAATATAVTACKSTIGRCCCPAVAVERMTHPKATLPYGCGDFPAAFDREAKLLFGPAATADGIKLVVE